ncbi:TolC family protein [Cedecea sp. MMO-103]|uniref:TolC family protein n=1 Tax=Cedecea sp. MMO-103 TaxID=3081238 RepID=UPI003015AD85
MAQQTMSSAEASLKIVQKQQQIGISDYLTALTAQRTLWSALHSLISLQQTALENRITLWQSLGGNAS